MSRRFSVLVGAVMMVATVGFTAARGEAAILVQPGLAGGSGDVDNVVFNATCTGATTGPGTTVQGCLNTDGSYLIDFESDEQLFTPSSGQARVEAVDGGFSALTIAPVSGTFWKLQLNILTNLDGTVMFSGSTGGSSSPFSLSTNGQNFFTITGDDEFSWVAFTTTTDVVADVRQVRLGPGSAAGGEPLTIPEPTSLMLVGLGIVGAGLARRYS